ncbi:MAG: energy transducer TonB [Halioglobus sp.]|nr:energy transducer TonB [Halioglobus sp.]
MYYLETGYDKHTRFRNAVLLALAVHATLILSISFSTSTSERRSPQIEVTLATRPTTVAPENAQYIAQTNQDGSGEEAPINQISSLNNVPSGSPALARSNQQTRQEHAAGQTDTVTTTAMTLNRIAKDQAEREHQIASLQGISPEVDRLNQELASLQAELDEQALPLATRPRVRRLTAASANQSADAAYLLDWRQRLEAVGNKYYPQASVRYGLYGDLRLLVVISHDGKLENIEVLSSSGYAVLDEAAIKIVTMAAPYSPFPEELRATTDKLEIVRTWHFQENQLSSK